MADFRSLKSMVDAAIKQIDKSVIAERSFYDDVSNRLFVTVFKGSRKTEFVLSTRHLNNDDSSRKEIENVVRDAIKRLDRTPIG